MSRKHARENDEIISDALAQLETNKSSKDIEASRENDIAVGEAVAHRLIAKYLRSSGFPKNYSDCPVDFSNCLAEDISLDRAKFENLWVAHERQNTESDGKPPVVLSYFGHEILIDGANRVNIAKQDAQINQMEFIRIYWPKFSKAQ